MIMTTLVCPDCRAAPLGLYCDVDPRNDDIVFECADTEHCGYWSQCHTPLALRLTNPAAARAMAATP